MSNDKLTRHQQAYFEAFVMILLMCWSPLKSLGYVAPVVALAWYITRSRDVNSVRLVVLWVTGWLAVSWGWGLFGRDFAFSGAILALFTYATFVLIYSVDARKLKGNLLLHKIAGVVVVAVYFEVAWGTAQVVYGFSQTGTFDQSTGDFVEGTIAPALSASRAFANPMYAANMSFMLLFLLTYYLRFRRGLAALCLGGAALVFASVVHVLVFLVCSVLVAVILYGWRFVIRLRPASIAIGVFILLIPVLVYKLLPHNVQSARNIIEERLASKDTRARSTERALITLPKRYPLMRFVGLGPGQYSSRAALINSGLYLKGFNVSGAFSSVGHSFSPTQRKYLLDLWMEADRNPYYGSTQQPYYSWLSIITEFGVPVFLAIVLAVTGALFKMRMRVKTETGRAAAIGWGASVLLLFLLGAQENYWEIPQAILIGAALMKILKAATFEESAGVQNATSVSAA